MCRPAGIQKIPLEFHNLAMIVVVSFQTFLTTLARTPKCVWLPLLSAALLSSCLPKFHCYLSPVRGRNSPSPLGRSISQKPRHHLDTRHSPFCLFIELQTAVIKQISLFDFRSIDSNVLITLFRLPSGSTRTTTRTGGICPLGNIVASSRGKDDSPPSTTTPFDDQGERLLYPLVFLCFVRFLPYYRADCWLFCESARNEI